MIRKRWSRARPRPRPRPRKMIWWVICWPQLIAFFLQWRKKLRMSESTSLLILHSVEKQEVTVCVCVEVQCMHIFFMVMENGCCFPFQWLSISKKKIDVEWSILNWKTTSIEFTQEWVCMRNFFSTTQHTSLPWSYKCSFQWTNEWMNKESILVVVAYCGWCSSRDSIKVRF